MPTLNWIGKEKVINHHQDVPFRVLEEQYSFGEPDGNRIIHGDNLDALKALLPQYEGRVNLIYIDPPYNTGNEKWIYNDNVNDPKIKKWLGDVVGKEGEDLTRHDKWLCMMYPRLKLLHRLLADDGAIFISIDDNEQANLKLICDEIFGANNFVSNIIWQKKFSPQNDAKYFSENHDHILCYAKAKEQFEINLLPRTNEMNNRYKNRDNDPRGAWSSSDLSVKTYSESYDYPITTPSGRIVNPPAGYCWRVSKAKYEEMVAENRMWFGANGEGVPRIKRFLTEVKQGITSMTIWEYTDVGHNQDAKKEVKIFNNIDVFDTPKPERLIERIITLATKEGDVVLDSFLGSGTTAAVAHKMNRKWIGIELGDHAATHCVPRIKAVIEGEQGGISKNVNWQGGGGFTYQELGEPLMFADGNLNESVGEEKIRDYVWYMETKLPVPENKADEPYFLGETADTAYYFYYKKDEVTTLGRSFLGTIQTKAEGYIIYTDRCVLSTDELKQYGITFKKIPRDIAKL